MGTPVSLGPGMYQVTEMAPVTPAGMIALDPVFSSECSGNIQAGQELSCSIINEFTDTINVGEFPVALEFSPTTNDIYVGNTVTDDVTVIAPNNIVVDTIDVGDMGNIGVISDGYSFLLPTDKLEYSPETGDIYVANAFSDTVTVIHPDGTTDTTPVGDGPQALEFSPTTNDIYVANSNTISSGTVTVIHPDGTTDTITVGDIPVALEFSPETGDIYVANAESGTVTVIPP